MSFWSCFFWNIFFFFLLSKYGWSYGFLLASLEQISSKIWKKSAAFTTTPERQQILVMRSLQAVANPHLKIYREAPVSASQATEVASKEWIRYLDDGNGIITKEKGDFIWRQIHQHQNWFIFFIIHISLISNFPPGLYPPPV